MQSANKRSARLHVLFIRHTQIHMATSSCLRAMTVSTVIGFACSHVQAQPNDPSTSEWVPGPGLWSMQGSMGGMAMPEMKLCSDGKTVPDVFGMNAQRQANAKSRCTIDAPSRDGDTVRYRSVCKVDEVGSTVEALTSITGGNTKSFRVEQRSIVSLKGAAPQTMVVNLNGKRVGAQCPKPMQAGDMMLPDGTISRKGQMIKR